MKDHIFIDLFQARVHELSEDQKEKVYKWAFLKPNKLTAVIDSLSSYEKADDLHLLSEVLALRLQVESQEE